MGYRAHGSLLVGTARPRLGLDFKVGFLPMCRSCCSFHLAAARVSRDIASIDALRFGQAHCRGERPAVASPGCPVAYLCDSCCDSVDDFVLVEYSCVYRVRSALVVVALRVHRGELRAAAPLALGPILAAVADDRGLDVAVEPHGRLPIRPRRVFGSIR